MTIDLGLVLNIMSTVFLIGAFILYKKTPKLKKHH